jgi:hypothetical protein
MACQNNILGVFAKRGKKESKSSSVYIIDELEIAGMPDDDVVLEHK